MDADIRLPSSKGNFEVPIDNGAERASLSRLRIASLFSGGGAVREMRSGQAGLMGWWFGLKLWRWNTKVADAVLSIRNSGEGAAAAIEDFMNGADIDVARFAIVGSREEPSSIADEVPDRKGVWYFMARREHRDLLNLKTGKDGFLARLGARARRNLRKSNAKAERAGLSFTFRERTGALGIGGEVENLAARNGPEPVARRHLAMFEQMLSHRPGSFESQLRTADGTLVSLCRGFVQGRTAYLIYQINDPAIPRINIGAVHGLRLIGELAARGAHELIFAMPSHQFKPACRVSSIDELITIRPSLRGLAIAAMLIVMLRGTRFGEDVRSVLAAILRHWLGLPKMAFENAVRALTPPDKNWARASAAAFGVLVSAAAVGTAAMMRDGLGILPYVTAYPAFLVATYLAGAWTGLLTITLGGLGILYYVVPPYNSFMVERSHDMWAAAIYVASALVLWFWFSRRPKTVGAA